MQGKFHREPFVSSSTRAENICDLIHMDLCGPMEVKSIAGSRYIFLLKDDHSNFKTTYFRRIKVKCLIN